MNRLILVALVVIALVSGIISCTPTLAHLIPATPAPTSASTVGHNKPLFEVTNRVFFDYNGNGIQDNAEPAIPGIKLTYQPENISCVADKNGLGTVKVPAGSYTISINDSSNKFNYILTSVSEITDIKDGLKVNISKSEEIPIPLAQGFLTWPFPEDVSCGLVYFFGPEDPTADPSTIFACEGGT
jgi:hypothetical protein